MLLNSVSNLIQSLLFLGPALFSILAFSTLEILHWPTNPKGQKFEFYFQILRALVYVYIFVYPLLGGLFSITGVETSPVLNAALSLGVALGLTVFFGFKGYGRSINGSVAGIELLLICERALFERMSILWRRTKK